MNRKGHYMLLLISMLMLFNHRPVAAESYNLTVKGNILDVDNCVINNGEKINVNFGADLITTKVDGTNYRQKVPYSMQCTKDVWWKMKFVATPAFADALPTSINELGIVLSTTEDKPIALNQWLPSFQNTPPDIYATPTKRPNATLKGGPFTGTVTLVVEKP